MWREVEPRASGRERAEPSRGSRSGVSEMGTEAPENARDPLTRDLDLPRGRTRERVRAHGRDYRLSGDDVRTLAAVGTFRVVPAGELRPSAERTPTRPARHLERLREAGLVHTTPYVVGRTRTTLVTLTLQGRDVLETHRRETHGEPQQAFYAGVVKPRELAHDTRLHQAYLRASERLATRGARVRRVVLEEELKRSYQRFLQADNRGRRDSSGRPTRSADAVADWARSHHLPCHDGHVDFPDVRLEYEGPDGRRAVEDIEVVTPHYRGAHAAAKVRAGFSRYRAVGARLGGAGAGGRGGRGRDVRLAEELLP